MEEIGRGTSVLNSLCNSSLKQRTYFSICFANGKKSKEDVQFFFFFKGQKQHLVCFREHPKQQARLHHPPGNDTRHHSTKPPGNGFLALHHCCLQKFSQQRSVFGQWGKPCIPATVICGHSLNSNVQKKHC